MLRIAVFMGFIAAAGLAGVLSLPEGRTQLKELILATDAKFFEGALRRVLHNQSLPTSRVLDEIPAPRPSAYQWLTTVLATHGFVSIAHKGGLEHLGTNSLLALRNGYKAGFRLLEIDFLKTPDDQVVCGHHWPNNGQPLTKKTYMEYTRQAGKIFCTLDDVIEFTNNHPDTFIVLDIKSDFVQTYQLIIEEIEQQATRSAAFIPQVYSFEQLSLTRSSRVFSGEIFTTYRSALTTAQIYWFAQQTGVQAVTMPLVQAARHQGYFPLPTFIHPVNDFDLLKKVALRGIKGIYTSYLSFPVLQMAGNPQEQELNMDTRISGK